MLADTEARMSLFFILVFNQTVLCPWPLMCPAHWSLELELGPSTHCPAVEGSAEHPLGLQRGDSDKLHVPLGHTWLELSAQEMISGKASSREPTCLSVSAQCPG